MSKLLKVKVTLAAHRRYARWSSARERRPAETCTCIWSCGVRRTSPGWRSGGSTTSHSSMAMEERQGQLPTLCSVARRAGGCRGTPYYRSCFAKIDQPM